MSTWEEVSAERDAWEDKAHTLIKDYLHLLFVIEDELGHEALTKVTNRLDNDRKQL